MLNQTAHQYSIEYVESCLAEAGESAVIWKNGPTRPSGYKSCLPEPVRDFMDAYNPDNAEGIRFNLTAEQVKRMEHVYGWVMALENKTERRLLMLASLRHPSSGKRIYSWRRLGKIFRIDHKTAKRWYINACSKIAGRLTVGIFTEL